MCYVLFFSYPTLHHTHNETVLTWDDFAGTNLVVEVNGTRTETSVNR
jgi:hypothetical protein